MNRSEEISRKWKKKGKKKAKKKKRKIQMFEKEKNGSRVNK